MAARAPVDSVAVAVVPVAVPAPVAPDRTFPAPAVLPQAAVAAPVVAVVPAVPPADAHRSARVVVAGTAKSSSR